MKRVLITGSGSYLGDSIACALGKQPEKFQVKTLDMREADWEQESFVQFDSVIHVAGIAHQKETPENAESYYRINRDLAVAVAEKAKADGVLQFVFFSSMSVYGLECGRITPQTQTSPKSHYGKSKLMAEKEINALAGDSFHVAVLRPPMIYGKGCRGNYPKLSRMIQKLSVFPMVPNERSMLYVEHLCFCVQKLIENGAGGLFFPQNKAYVSTNELARQIALAHSRKLWQPKGTGWLIHGMARCSKTMAKVFGTLLYEQTMCKDFADLPEIDFAKTIQLTEAKP